MRARQKRRGGISLLAFVPYPLGTTPSQRFRIEQWAPLLARDDIEVTFAPFAGPELMSVLYRPGHPLVKTLGAAAAFWKQARRILGCRAHRAVLIHRAVCLIGPAVLERGLHRLGVPIIYD